MDCFPLRECPIGFYSSYTTALLNLLMNFLKSIYSLKLVSSFSHLCNRSYKQFRNKMHARQTLISSVNRTIDEICHLVMFSQDAMCVTVQKSRLLYSCVQKFTYTHRGHEHHGNIWLSMLYLNCSFSCEK